MEESITMARKSFTFVRGAAPANDEAVCLPEKAGRVVICEKCGWNEDRAMRRGITLSKLYSAIPWFWSDQADDKLQIVGLVPQCADRVVRRSKNDRSFSIFSFQNGLLASVETLNSPAEHMIARRLLGASVPIRPEQAEDPRFDLASLLSVSSKPIVGLVMPAGITPSRPRWPRLTRFPSLGSRYLLVSTAS
jgi:hypothetical protein